MPAGAFSKSDLRIDQRLTNIALGWSNPIFIADELFPELPGVSGDSDKIMVYGDDTYGYGGEKSEWPDGADYNFVDDSVSDITFDAVQYAFARKVTESNLRNMRPPHKVWERAAFLLRQRYFLALEIATATKATTQGNYPASNRTQLSGTSQWSDDSSDPVGVIIAGMEAARQNGGMEPNVLVISAEVKSHLLQHPDIVARIPAAAGGLATLDQLKAMFVGFGLEKVVVGKARRNAAKEGQTSSKSDVWGKHAVLAYVTQTADLLGSEGAYGWRASSEKFTIDREPKVKRSTVLNAVGNWHLIFGTRDSNGDALSGYLIEDAVA